MHHGLGPGAFWGVALTRQPIVKSTKIARDRIFTARQACAETLGQLYLKDCYRRGARRDDLGKANGSWRAAAPTP
jgi:hypothetical protein